MSGAPEEAGRPQWVFCARAAVDRACVGCASAPASSRWPPACGRPATSATGRPSATCARASWTGSNPAL